MKSITKTVLILIASVQLIGCGEECTEETLNAKGEELTEKMQEVAASGDMKKIMGLAQKMGKFKNLVNDPDNLQAACDAVDELLAEL
jgi:hypothetical protein